MGRNGYGNRDLSDSLQDVLVGCAKFLLYLGAAAAVVCTGLLIFTVFKVTSDANSMTSAQIADAVRNVELFQKVLVVGVLALAIGSCYLFWGSEFLGFGQMVFGGALYFAPLYLPSIIGSAHENDVTKNAYGSLQSAGMVLGVIGVIATIADVVIRITQRTSKGAKADHLKYGKGVKEEPDRQNILLGKCWQLPYCRKFVREKCPIYHARTSCWKEQVGCMCEESVIRNAMENKPIPKDAVLAASYIPHNNKLTFQQKRERCYNCVIYNEHLRHKYKLSMWITVPAFLVSYALFHGVLYSMVEGLIGKVNYFVNKGTLGAYSGSKPPTFFVEALLAVFMIIGLTYALRAIEFAFFKMKV